MLEHGVSEESLAAGYTQHLMSLVHGCGWMHAQSLRVSRAWKTGGVAVSPGRCQRGDISAPAALLGVPSLGWPWDKGQALPWAFTVRVCSCG